MITTVKKYTLVILILSCVSLLFNGCKKDDEVEPNIELANFTVAGGQIWGDLNVSKADDVAEKGVVIGLTSGPTNDNNSNSTSTITTIDDIYVFNDLELTTTYFIRGYTKSKKGNIKFSNELSFTTKCLEIDSILPRTISDATTEVIVYGRGFSNTPAENVITFYSDCFSGNFVKVPSAATNTQLTVDISDFNIGQNECDIYTTVDNTLDACTAGGSILSKINNYAPKSYSYSYSGNIKYIK